jgi:hypothetical protein
MNQYLWDSASQSNALTGGGQSQWDASDVHANSNSNSNSNIWATSMNVPKNNAYYRGGGGEAESVYSSSKQHPSSDAAHGYNNGGGRWYGHHQQGHNNNNMGMSENDIAASMNRMHISHNSGAHYRGGGGASIASMASGGSSIPGVVGASSGSTGGSTAMSMWKDPSGKSHHYPLQHPQQQMYPTQYPQQQHQKQQQQHQVPRAGFTGPPPGFLSPIKPSRAEDDSVSFDSRSSKRSGGKRLGPRNNNNNNKGRHGNNQNKNHNGNRRAQHHGSQPSLRVGHEAGSPSPTIGDDATAASSKASSEAIRMLMKFPSSSASLSSSHGSALTANRLPLDRLSDSPKSQATSFSRPILPAMEDVCSNPFDQENDEEEDEESSLWGDESGVTSPKSKKKDWLLRMNRRMAETPVGEMDPSSIPISAIMNAWAKTKSSQGASMVESWLKRAQLEFDAGNMRVVPTTKMYTMAGMSNYFSIAWRQTIELVLYAQLTPFIFIFHFQSTLGPRVAKECMPQNEQKPSCNTCMSYSKLLAKRTCDQLLGFSTPSSMPGHAREIRLHRPVPNKFSNGWTPCARRIQASNRTSTRSTL